MSPEDTRARGIKAAASVDSARLERRLHSQRRTSYPRVGLNASPPPQVSPRIHEPALPDPPRGWRGLEWPSSCARILAVLAREPELLSMSAIAMWADVHVGKTRCILDALCAAALAERVAMHDLGRIVFRYRLLAEQGGAR